MRIIKDDEIISRIEKLCIQTNCVQSPDLKKKIENCKKTETSKTGKFVLEQIDKNAEIAKNNMMPMCQDTGMAVFFVEMGNNVIVEGMNITEAINEGVRRGYKKGYLRKSVVKDPFFRKNTNDNTPAVIHYDMVDGDKIKIAFAPKGFGSENMSALSMLKPSDGQQGMKEFVLETVKKAGPNPCPPVVVGVGVGGTMEKASLLAKKALLRPLDTENPVKYLNELEAELLDKINATGIGPGGLGGKNTALKVNINVYPTHIAGLPVAVNINCHASRHAEIEI